MDAQHNGNKVQVGVEVEVEVGVEEELDRHLKGVYGAFVRGEKVFVIGQLELRDAVGLDPIGETIWAQISKFPVSDLLPRMHFLSIFERIHAPLLSSTHAPTSLSLKQDTSCDICFCFCSFLLFRRLFAFHFLPPRPRS